MKSVHPVVSFWFFLGFSISILLTKTYYGCFVYFLLLLVIAFFNFTISISILKKLKPFIYYFPIVLCIYIFFSIFLTTNSLVIIMNEALLGFIKLILMLTGMMYFFEIKPSKDLVIILRSIWVRFDLPWKWVENFFLFLSLTLRFYPTFQSNWNSVRNYHRTLGLESNFSNFKKLKDIAKEMPALLIYQLRQADDISTAMNLRGYGKNFPRGVTNPILFNFYHLIIILGITIFYYVFHHYVSL